MNHILLHNRVNVSEGSFVEGIDIHLCELSEMQSEDEYLVSQQK